MAQVQENATRNEENTGKGLNKGLGWRFGKKRGRAVIALALVALLGVSAFVTNGFGLLASNAVADFTNYQVLDLTTGNLTKSVTGTGSISMKDTTDITIPAGVTVSTVPVQAGQSVKREDTLATLDAQSIADQIESIEAELDTLDDTLASLSGDTAAGTIRATVAGRVKLLYAEKNDEVAKVVQEEGALLVLSVDGTMRVDIDLAEGQTVTVGQTVYAALTSSSTTLEGTVSWLSADSKSATVLIPDRKPEVGEEIALRDQYNNLLGKGTAQINNALRITGTVGTIASVNVALHQEVSKSQSLYSLENLPLSTDYQAALRQREELLADLAEMQAYQQSPRIRATADGIVGSIGVTANQTLTEDAVITLSTRESATLTVAVDELEILSVATGMTASVTLSATGDEVFTGTVTFLSASGTTTSNVTTYPVEIQLADDSRFLPGMSGTAEIVVQESRNALLVPVSALSTSRGQTYAYVYNGTLPSESSETDSTEPGTRTLVTTGLSDENYAEVLSGLSADQQVVVASSTGTSVASAATQQERGMMGGGMMMDFGGGGGERPQGGGSSNGGGFGGPPSN